MDVSSIANAFIGAKTAQLQMAVAAKMIKTNTDADRSIAQLIDAAQQNASSLANVAAGVGSQLDISV